MAILIGIAVQLCLVLYWELWPFKVFRFTAPIHILTPVIKQGAELEYEMSYCKEKAYEDFAAEIQIVYVDDQLIYTPASTQFIEPGCRTEKITTTIPRMPAGNYTLVLYRNYQLNPFRQMRFRSESEKFLVTE